MPGTKRLEPWNSSQLPRAGPYGPLGGGHFEDTSQIGDPVPRNQARRADVCTARALSVTCTGINVPLLGNLFMRGLS